MKNNKLIKIMSKQKQITKLKLNKMFYFFTNLCFRIELDDIIIDEIITDAPECKTKKIEINQKQNESLIQIDLKNENFDQKQQLNQSTDSDLLLFRVESPLGILDETKENTKNLALDKNDLFNLNINEFDLKNNQTSNNLLKNNAPKVSLNNQTALILSTSSEFVDLNLNLPECSNHLCNTFNKNNIKPIKNEFESSNSFKINNKNKVNDLLFSNEFISNASNSTNTKMNINYDTNVKFLIFY